MSSRIAELVRKSALFVRTDNGRRNRGHVDPRHGTPGCAPPSGGSPIVSLRVPCRPRRILHATEKPGDPALYFHVNDAVNATHLAFKASTAEQVANSTAPDLLPVAVRDNGAPGPRPAYGKDYYAGFVYDPDGHNVEAVVGGVG